MTAVYLETSAVLAWLLGESRGAEVRSAVGAARMVVTSVLTLAETDRALIRCEMSGQITAADAQRLRGLVQRVRASWVLMEITEEILARVARAFPIEPVRTLDAIHLATALSFTKALPDLGLVSHDRRILDNARALGVA